MATITTRTSNKSIGLVSMQQGETDNGIPNHSAPNGTLFVDVAYNQIWKRYNSIWELNPVLCWGAIYTQNQSSIIPVTANIWTTFEGIYTWTASELKNVSHSSNGRLYINTGFDGKYLVSLYASINYTTTTGRNIDFGISLNGASPRNQDYYSIYGYSTRFSPAVYGIQAILDLVAGDYVTMAIRINTTSNNLLAVNTYLTLIKVS